MLTIQPRSISAQVLDDLQARIKTLSDAFAKSVPRYGRHDSDIKGKTDIARNALRSMMTYARFLRALAHLRYIDPNTDDFDNHDQVSSMLLHAITQFDRWRALNGGEPKNAIQPFVIGCWGWVNSKALLQFRRKNTIEERSLSNYKVDIAIVTALEHEYQSVIRRLDDIIMCTEDTAAGFSIVDRMDPTEDLKDSRKRLGGDMEMGWTLGRIHDEIVFVICTGCAGKEKALECKTSVIEILRNVPQKGWLVVGICAGTNETWPIGTILVSDKAIGEMEDPASSKYELRRKFAPSKLFTSHQATVAIERLYRRPPARKGDDYVRIADPLAVPIYPVKFACTRDVINLKTAREAIRDCLVEKKFLKADEDFGIEMEGSGVSQFDDRDVYIIKGVCDHANNKKGNPGWKEEKVLFQLYAAETAAEYATMLIRGLKTSNPRKPGPSIK